MVAALIVVRIWSARQYETGRTDARRCEVETLGVYGLQARRASIAGSLERSHNPKVAGSNPAPATKKTLRIPTCAEGFLASRIAGNAHVKPVSNIGHRSGVGVSVIDVAPLTVDATPRAASAWAPICAVYGRVRGGRVGVSRVRVQFPSLNRRCTSSFSYG